MAIDYWGEMPESTGDYEQKGGGPVIPEGTRVLATVEEIKTQTFKDSKHESLNLKWRIEEPEEYNNKVFNQKIKNNGEDPLSQYYDPAKQENATKAMKITSDDLLSLKLIDAIIDEPLVGAHRDKESAIKALGTYFIDSLDEMGKLSQKERLDKRYERILSHGAYEERCQRDFLKRLIKLPTTNKSVAVCTGVYNV